MLSGCLSNIIREIHFFEDTAQSHDISLETHTSGLSEESTALLGLLAPNTKAYIDFMLSVASTGTFEEGLVLLWAMEKLYLDAWSFAASQPPASENSVPDNHVRKALDALIDNWTSSEFRAFVQELGDIVNEVVGSPGPHLEGIWASVLWLEQRFWGADLVTNDSLDLASSN